MRYAGTSRRIRAEGRPRLLWPAAVWVLIGTEILAISWFHFSFVPVDRSLEGYLWHCAVLYGSPGLDAGFVRALQVVNTLVVLGLWVAFRSARAFDGRQGKTTWVWTLFAAMALATVGWWAARAQERCRPLEIRAVYELGPDGEYEILESGGR